MNNIENFSFSKNEKITSKDKIDKLYKSGKPVKAFPLYAKYIIVNTQITTCQILISVSKKKLRKAVDRNKIKRLIREAYRLNKSSLLETITKNNLKIAIVINYSLSEITDYATINNSVLKLINKISFEVNEK